MVRRAIDEGYVLVTNNRTDFTSLMRSEPHHPGLLCLNLAHGLMRLEAQKELFRYALLVIGDTDLEAQFLEITLDPNQTISTERYSSINENC